MCEYCIDALSNPYEEDSRSKDMAIKKFKLGIFETIMQVSVNFDKEIVCRFGNYDNSKEVRVSKKINYCPMCGQKL